MHLGYQVDVDLGILSPLRFICNSISSEAEGFIVICKTLQYIHIQAESDIVSIYDESVVCEVL